MQILPQRVMTPGECLLHGNYPVEALPFIEEDIRRHPERGGHWNNIGMCYKFLGRYEEAIAAFKRCLELEPGIVPAHHNLGMCYEETGRFDDALREFAYTCSWAPDENNMYALGACLLRERKFDKALEYWERARIGKLSAIIIPNIRMWRGENLAGNKIVVTREGGFGDIFWLLRYLEPLKELGAHVSFQVHGPMKSLLDGNRFIDLVVPDTEPVDAQFYDYQIPLWSLPWELRKMGVADIPMDRGPYIHVEPLAKTKGVNVGLAPYGGEALSVYRKMRSIQPEYVEEFAKLPVNWTWLCGEKAPEWCAASIVRGCSWLETAKVIAGLDIVVAVDSSVFHLAAAMGKPVLLAVPLGSDWKFFHEQETCSWYRSVRLFRNTDAVSFKPVVDQIVGYLENLLSGQETAIQEEPCEART